MHPKKHLYDFNTSFYLMVLLIAKLIMFIYTYGTTSLILMVEVDDFILVSSSSFVIHNFISLLSKQFI